MVNHKIIIKRIYEEQKVELLLEKAGCQHVSHEQQGSLITGQLPEKFESKNKRSVQIRYNEYLSGVIWSRDIKGNIIDVLGYLLFECKNKDQVKKKFRNILEWICNELGWFEYFVDVNGNFVKKTDPLKWLKEIKEKRNGKSKIRNIELSRDILNQYIMLPNIIWLTDGISIEVQKEFEVGFDIETERIIFPVYDEKGKLVSVKGRYVGNDEETLNTVKYLYLYPFNKSLVLYNFHRALPYIQQKKEVIVVEGEKTVMILHGWEYKNVVAVGGSDLTYHQIKILKELGLYTQIVLVFDKDKDKQFILDQVKKFGNIGIKRIRIVFDTKEYLRDKMSPVDLGIDVWENLYRECKFKIKIS